MQADQVTILKGARGDLAALANGQDRATVALNALKEVADLTPQQRITLQDIAARYEDKAAADTKQLTQNLATFVATYKIRAIEGRASEVNQTIPTDKTFANFLNESQALSIALHTAFPEKYEASQAIWPELLEKLLADPSYQVKGTGVETTTGGCVPQMEGAWTRAGATQKLASQGLKHEADHVLVAAHTGRYLLDATSILEGQVVRAAGCVFVFDGSGLRAPVISDVFRYSSVSSSARRPPSELKI